MSAEPRLYTSILANNSRLIIKMYVVICAGTFLEFVYGYDSFGGMEVIKLAHQFSKNSSQSLKVVFWENI